ncbi:11856_t:CDS:2 [Cetraspora pellucida]|uniref:11856_t:CDS:1 n=1 Tax=Cetraspora pellucida TaxID=1433469 RepID=A0ACA9LRF5_9GLOM|nr:11856_t:CDS:2 [Cetraspora pellucida]
MPPATSLNNMQNLNIYNDSIQYCDIPKMLNYTFNFASTLINPSALVSNLSDNKLKANNLENNIFGLDDLEEVKEQEPLLFVASNTLENADLLELDFDLEKDKLELELDLQEFDLEERISKVDKQEFELEAQEFELGEENNDSKSVISIQMPLLLLSRTYTETARHVYFPLLPLKGYNGIIYDPNKLLMQSHTSYFQDIKALENKSKSEDII